jgi:hypothetical protein
MNAEYAEIEEQATLQPGALKDLVPMLVLGTAELLHRHAPVLKAIVEAAWSDAVVGQRGREIYLAHERTFRDLVLRKRVGYAMPNRSMRQTFATAASGRLWQATSDLGIASLRRGIDGRRW